MTILRFFMLRNIKQKPELPTDSGSGYNNNERIVELSGYHSDLLQSALAENLLQIGSYENTLEKYSKAPAEQRKTFQQIKPQIEQRIAQLKSEIPFLQTLINFR